MTDSCKQYAKEVLQAATQHLLNIADLVDGTIADHSAAADDCDTNCQTLLQVHLHDKFRILVCAISVIMFCRVSLQPRLRLACVTSVLCKHQSACTDIRKSTAQLVSIKKALPVHLN